MLENSRNCLFLDTLMPVSIVILHLSRQYAEKIVRPGQRSLGLPKYMECSLEQWVVAIVYETMNALKIFSMSTRNQPQN